jgi:excisionase family DNA binding protein
VWSVKIRGYLSVEIAARMRLRDRCARRLKQMVSEQTTWRMMSVPEVAEQLGLSERFVATLISNGKLKSVKQGRRRLIDSRDLDEYVTSLKGESNGR